MSGSIDLFEGAKEYAAKELDRILRGNYTAILALGSGARGEISSAPDGKLLSDLDLIIVMPYRNLLLSFAHERLIQKKYSKQLKELQNRGPVSIQVSFVNASPLAWSSATPLMWELRISSQVLRGSSKVKEWPAIKQSDQIPPWEGNRLVANRICEFLGCLDQLTANPATNGFSFYYACLKLALACSEAKMIDQHLYQATYAERFHQQFLQRDLFSPAEQKLIETAYRAKLGLDHEFFHQRPELLMLDVLRLALSTLSQSGISTPADWERKARLERRWNLGLRTDIFFFMHSLLRGKWVPPRHAVLKIYIEALDLSNILIAPQTSLNLDSQIIAKGQEIYRCFKMAPQFCSVIINKRFDRN